MFNLFKNKDQVKDTITLRTYTATDGKFDYESYKRIQTEGNKKKIEQSWVKEDEIEFLSDVIKKYVPKPTFGICHGTRKGLEQKWFKHYLNCDKVIGTEISDTAKNFQDTVEWDFHDKNPEWVGKADFVYTNSFDHCYDPQKALGVWMESLTPGGICIIEHTDFHRPQAVNQLDPFGIELEFFPYQILNWSNGNYFVVEIVKSDLKNDLVTELNYLVIKNAEN